MASTVPEEATILQKSFLIKSLRVVTVFPSFCPPGAPPYLSYIGDMRKHKGIKVFVYWCVCVCVGVHAQCVQVPVEVRKGCMVSSSITLYYCFEAKSLAGPGACVFFGRLQVTVPQRSCLCPFGAGVTGIFQTLNFLCRLGARSEL